MPRTGQGTSTIETKTNLFIAGPVIRPVSWISGLLFSFLVQISLPARRKKITYSRRADDFRQVEEKLREESSQFMAHGPHPTVRAGRPGMAYSGGTALCYPDEAGE
jgi:hypothetical protein